MSRRAAEQKEQAWDLWLDCLSEREIGAEIDVPRKTLADWVGEKRNDPDFAQPPESRQHFDIWTFPPARDDSVIVGRRS
ncbi:hypothetical protein BH24ACT4_BH24ACT4_24160 [soil metagenome]